MRSLILQTVAPIVLHLTLLLSLFLLLFGHNQPGGGFIAGLMTAVGLILQWISFGSEECKRRFPWPWDLMPEAGVSLAAIVGVFGLIFGAFLKSNIYEFNLPFIGQVELITPFLFDLGVYGVVVGVTITVITILSEKSVDPS